MTPFCKEELEVFGIENIINFNKNDDYKVIVKMHLTNL
jgi:hypothetical protein